MKHRWRLIGFLVGAIGLALLLAIAFVAIPGPGLMRNRYARDINSLTFAQRNITDAVTAVNFDYRGFDTIGEEFILFVSVMGSIVLLREAEEKRERLLRDAVVTGRDVGPSDAIRLWILVMVAPKIVFGIYVVTHGQLSPGGGFQGGVILATAALIIYLGEDFAVFKRIVSHPLIESGEAIGAGVFVLLGVLGWIWGKPFLTNVLPLGKAHALTSGGIIALISLATGLEITAGFVTLMFGFLQETLTAGE